MISLNILIVMLLFVNFVQFWNFLLVCCGFFCLILVFASFYVMFIFVFVVYNTIHCYVCSKALGCKP